MLIKLVTNIRHVGGYAGKGFQGQQFKGQGYSETKCTLPMVAHIPTMCHQDSLRDL